MARHRSYREMAAEGEEQHGRDNTAKDEIRLGFGVDCVLRERRARTHDIGAKRDRRQAGCRGLTIGVHVVRVRVRMTGHSVGRVYGCF